MIKNPLKTRKTYVQQRPDLPPSSWDQKHHPPHHSPLLPPPKHQDLHLLCDFNNEAPFKCLVGLDSRA